jgi:hypothetical protein
MPTVMIVNGWRFFFYANEGNEPMHIHCRKAEKECKYWLSSTGFEVQRAYAYHLSPGDEREVKRILFEYFEDIETAWRKMHGDR